MDLVVVDGATLKSSLGVITATINPLTSVLSNRVKCNDSKAYHTIGFNASAEGYVTTPYVILGNTINVKGGGLSFVIDTALMPVSLPFEGTGPPLVDNIVIDDSGQAEVKFD